MLRSLLIASLFLFTSVAAPAQSRVTENFDAGWLFTKGDPAGAERPEFDDSSWRKLNVPHDWSIEGPFDAKNVTGGAGGFLPSGIGWYRKHFTVPADQSARRIFIEFDGVMANSDVWINNFHLGKRPYGYVSFWYDLSDHLNFRKDNVIVVRVDNEKQPASRWYTGAGIYRHVRLVSTNGIHLEKWATFITTPKVTAAEATVAVTSKVINEYIKPGAVSFDVKVVDDKGRTVATAASKTAAIRGSGSADLNLQIAVKDPRRWDIGSGTMYKAVVSIVSQGRIVDSESIPFGIREFHFDPATGFWLNGKNLKIKGACLHHDGSAFGAAVPLAVWERRLTELRKLGVNAVRNSHNPAGDFLDLADRMGFLVMDELFDQWTLPKNPYDYHLYFDEWAKTDVRDTVRRDRNHPSIVIYSAGNEIRDNHADPEKAKATLRGLVDTFHENDPTRPVTQALFRPNIEGADDYNNGLADMLDVVGQNYREKEILAAYKQKPTRKIIGTENTNDLNQWLALRNNPEYSGQFIWVGVDYLGESGAWPNYAYGKGLLDRTAMPRPVAYQRQSWWSASPMVYMARRMAPPVASPTDPGYELVEQKRTQTLFGDWTPKDLSPHQENVEVYSNCQDVELFLNGKSLGSKSKPADDRPRNWMVTFEPGTIRADCRNAGTLIDNAWAKNGALLPTYELRTADRPVAIKLTVNNARLTHDWDDVAFVTATVIDANGVPVPDANNLIRFNASGPGTIVAVDSADNADHDPFQATQRKAFQGICLAYVKTDKTAGKIVITAQSAGLKSSTITITAVPSSGQ